MDVNFINTQKLTNAHLNIMVYQKVSNKHILYKFSTGDLHFM